MAKDKETDLSAGFDIDPEEFAKEALTGFGDSKDEVEDDVTDDVEEEEVDEEIEDDPDTDPADEQGDPDTGSETSDGGNADAQTDDDAEDDDESDPIAARARELGLGDNFRSAEEVLESHKALKTRLAQRDDEAAFGRLVRERGLTPEHVEALASKGQRPDGDSKQQADPRGWNPPVKFDRTWKDSVKPKYDDEGDLVGYDGPADAVRDFQKWDAYRKAFWGDVMDDPTRLGEVLDPIIERRVQELEKVRRESSAKQQAEAATQAFMAKHGDFIDAHEAEFFAAVERGMDPDLAIEYLELKHKKPEPPAKGEDGKKKDLDTARTKRRERRAGSKVSPIRRVKKPAEKSEEEILAGALEGMSEEDRAAMGLR